MKTRYSGYYITYRLFGHGDYFGFAKVGVSYSYRHYGNIGPKAGTTYDEQEEKVSFRGWIEIYPKMIKTKKYDLPVKYDDLAINEKRAVRLQYMTEQSMLCKHCEMYLTEEPSYDIMLTNIDWELFPKGFQKHPIHLHHDHKTGLTIGAVHMRCNAYLWQYKGE